jgi:glycosyltransferase involved in cell wall biosynthesis
VAVELKTILSKLPRENVEFVGNLPQAELARCMSTSHLLVLPSLEEGLALVQAQAMACGCPVLASTNTGSEDLFTDGVDGFIVPIRDVEALRDRMQQLADDSDLQRRMGELSLARVRHMGGWSQYGDQWEALRVRLRAEAS